MNHTQTDLFRYPETPGYKDKQSETSAEAARSMIPKATTLRARVLERLKVQNATADEVAAALGETILAIRPRLSELRAQGRIVDTGHRRPNISGKVAVVWTVTRDASEDGQ